jgi:hypothetical protein
MRREIRRKDRAILLHEAIEILASGEYGVLSSVDSDDQPYGVPVSYRLIDDAIYFHCFPEGHKLDNIAHNEKVSFCVVGKTEVLPDKFSIKYESSIVFGRATELFETEKSIALLGFLKKYSPDFIAEGMKYIDASFDKVRVYKISIDSISGKSRK